MHLVFLPKINSFELVMGNFYWTYILDKILNFYFYLKKKYKLHFTLDIEALLLYVRKQMPSERCSLVKKKLRCGSQQSLKELNIPRNYKINKQIKGAWWKWMMY